MRACGLHKAQKIKAAESFLRACGLHRVCTRLKTAEPFYDVQGASMYSIYRLMQLIFSTSLKGIIRKDCQSFTNHGHAKTPPTVFNPLSLWLTLPRDMGVSHTQWPSSITRAILACLWFAQGLHKAQKKSKQQSRSMMFRVLL